MKKFTTVLYIVLAVVCGLAGWFAVALAITGDPEDPSFSVASAVVAAVFLALFGLFTWAADHFGKFRQKRAQKKARKEAEAQAQQEALEKARQDALDQARKDALEKAQQEAEKQHRKEANDLTVREHNEVIPDQPLVPAPDLLTIDKYIGANFAIVSGLNLPAGVRCSVQLMGDHLSIRSQNQEFILSNSKIVSVMVHTAKEIQKQYVSSVGGAVAGGLLAGPLGMIVGGMAQKKTITNKTPLLIFAYQSGSGDVQYLIFNAEASPWNAQRFVKAYRGLTKSMTITTEL